MSYIFYSPVSAPYQKTEEMLRYAKINCSSFTATDIEQRRDDWYYRFYFSDEKDYFLFTLKWS